MTYYVSRQRYWGVDEEDGTVVEIAAGGSDYANPDQLGVLWPELGEGKEFSDPRDAVEAAINICEAWRRNGEHNAKVAYGYTAGMTLPFEPTDYAALRDKAEESYQKLPKCRRCEKILGKETFGNDFTEMEEKKDRYPFCSESCAEHDHEQVMKDTQDEECNEGNHIIDERPTDSDYARCGNCQQSIDLRS